MKRPKTIRIQGHASRFDWTRAWLHDLTARELKEHLRSRKIGIPKTKGEMVRRLALALVVEGFDYTLTIR